MSQNINGFESKASLSRTMSFIKDIKAFEYDLIKVDYKKLQRTKDTSWFVFATGERVSNLKFDFSQLNDNERNFVREKFLEKNIEYPNVDINDLLERNDYDKISPDAVQYMVGAEMFQSFIARILE